TLQTGGDTAREHQQEVHQTWSKIYGVLGSRNVPGHEILRFAATLKHEDEPSKTLGSEAAFSFFRDRCLAEPTKVVEVSTWLYDVATSLDNLYKNPRLSAVTDIAHARLLAVSLMQTSALQHEGRQQMLELWEKVSFRIFSLFRRDSRTAVGDYVRAAHRIHTSKLKTEGDIRDAIKQIAKDYPVDQAVREMKKGADCYNGWELDLRYFLYRYEEYLCELEGGGIASELWEQIWQSSPNTSIEHIHPQTRNAVWRGKLGRGRYSLEANVNRLGNLLLLPPNVNSSAGQKSFAEKKRIYKKNYLRMHNDVLSVKDWTKQAIDARETKLLEWARNEWAD
ncbi:MAG: HNH endonuclease, partial [Planctomycetes bacterium]|nr:HNH endonuclease [Planctomycetota bacterium]